MYYFPKANKNSQKSRARGKHDKAYFTGNGTYLFIESLLPQGTTENQNLPSLP